MLKMPLRVGEREQKGKDEQQTNDKVRSDNIQSFDQVNIFFREM